MDREYIRDHQIIERYLRRTLSPDEEARFEEAYLADPDLLDEIELVERLQQGLQGRARPSWRAVLTSPQYAAAASVLFAATLAISGMLYRENLTLRDSQGPAAVTIMPLDATRGVEPVVIRAPANGEWLVLWLDAGAPEYDSYRVVVRASSADGSGEVVRRDGLVSGYEARIPFAVTRDTLAPGDYEIELEGRFSEWPASREFAPVSTTAVRIEGAAN